MHEMTVSGPDLETVGRSAFAAVGVGGDVGLSAVVADLVDLMARERRAFEGTGTVLCVAGETAGWTVRVLWEPLHGASVTVRRIRPETR